MAGLGMGTLLTLHGRGVFLPALTAEIVTCSSRVGAESVGVQSPAAAATLDTLHPSHLHRQRAG